MTVEELYKIFSETDLTYFTGVPDSTFKSWMSFLSCNEDKLQNRIAVNEGAAIAHATGYHLSTGKTGVVYLQNSGLGNCVNPLTSLTDKEVYSIPMLLMIGWRGEPGVKDEPQHIKMGAITKELLDVLDVPYFLLEEGSAINVIKEAKEQAIKESRPVALIVKKDLLSSYEGIKSGDTQAELTREEVIEFITREVAADVVVGTTGKTSRELFELREKLKQGHGQDFYTVGSMGHASAIALEISLQKNNKKVLVLDGDGALLMHMGGLATVGNYGQKNLIHVVFDNECHESTGGQPTVSKSIDLVQLAKACSYDAPQACKSFIDIMNVLSIKDNKPKFIVIKVKPGSRKDLGRPTLTPLQNKEAFMQKLGE